MMQGNNRAVQTALIALAATVMLMQTAVSVEVQSDQKPKVSTSSVTANDQDLLQSKEKKSVIPTYVLRSQSFSIPFNVQKQGLNPTEVKLYVLTPNATDWVLHESKPVHPSHAKFDYFAELEGGYLFATRTISPSVSALNEPALTPQIRILVDTTAPTIRLDTETNAEGSVEIRYSVEDFSAIQEIELRYATNDDQRWRVIETASTGKTGLYIVPKNNKIQWASFSVELTATDQAGNTSRATRQMTHAQLLAGEREVASSIQMNREVASNHQKSMTFAASDQHPQGIDASDNAGVDSESAVLRHSVGGFLAGFRDRVASVAAQSNSKGNRSGDTTANVSDSADASQLNLKPNTDGGLSEGERAIDLIVPKINESNSNSVTSDSYETLRIAQYGNQTARPISLFEKLFGIAPPQLPLTQVKKTEDPKAYSSFTAPSFSAPVPAQLVGNPQDLLPPPASPSQIGDGFELKGPNQNRNVDASDVPAKPTQDSQLGSRNELLPETLPAPANRLPAGSSDRDVSKTDRRAETPAQAMRPINESSEVIPLLQDKGDQQEKPESSELPSEEESIPLYRSRRNDLSDSQPVDREFDAMLARVPTRFSKGKRFSLDYELEAVGLQGAESIELYGTTDGGKTWQLWGSDPDRQSPFDIETQDIGVFGFRICVVGRNGLASPRPQAGEAPDIFVVVDVEKPQVQITGARYGEGSRVGSLVISYKCLDANLPERPITLAFSESLDGPWTTIAGGLRNEGQYIWAADPNLPRQLYLRIDATDEAGNRGVYLLDQPIDTQGLAPRARIRGFQPLSEQSIRPKQSGKTAKRTRNQF